MLRHTPHALRNLFLLVTAFLIPVGSGDAAVETYGNWDRETRVEYSAMLFAAVRKHLNDRIARLQDEAGLTVTLEPEHLKGEERVKFLERLAKKRASDEELQKEAADLTRQCQILVAKEAEARAIWKSKKEKAVASTPSPALEGEIYGQKIKARKLGALLDRSASMESYIPGLRKIIDESFHDSPTVEVWGSGLQVPSQAWFPVEGQSQPMHGQILNLSWFLNNPGAEDDLFDPGWNLDKLPIGNWHFYHVTADRCNATALLAMVRLHKVDAIYWFCDLRDDIDDESVKIIGKEILENKVQLHIHSVGKRPKGLLSQLVERSGGSIITKKPRPSR